MKRLTLILALIASFTAAFAQKHITDSLMINGQMRTYTMFLPEGIQKDAPLVVFMHGYSKKKVKNLRPLRARPCGCTREIRRMLHSRSARQHQPLRLLRGLPTTSLDAEARNQRHLQNHRSSARALPAEQGERFRHRYEQWRRHVLPHGLRGTDHIPRTRASGRHHHELDISKIRSTPPHFHLRDSRHRRQNVELVWRHGKQRRLGSVSATENLHRLLGGTQPLHQH